MRVISGTAKGHKLDAPKGSFVRPTNDKVKEAVFSMITPYIEEECSFLDLFCGTGSMGIEALSRGVGEAVFIDSSAVSLEYAEKNLKHTKLIERALLIKDSIPGGINKLKGKKFDIIFLDPPYGKKLENIVLGSILKNDLLKQSGVVIVEYSYKDKLFYNGFTLIKSKNYSAVNIDILELQENTMEDINEGSIPRQF